MADNVHEEGQEEESHEPPRKKAKNSNASELEQPATKSKRERRLRHQPKDVLEFSEDIEHAGINAYNFAQARADELKAMVKTTASRSTGKRVFQSLPRHMRRRAMSHNVKRLPRRLRQAAEREMASQIAGAEGSSKKKPPSRRARRRPRDLAEEYKKREDKCTWLETHIWHSKRMKMVAKWDFKLALKRADKGVRAAYRSMKNECLLSDISYYCCIEVCGPQADILAALNRLTSPDAGLTCGAPSFLSGERGGKVLLYQAGQFPWGFIGPAHLLWKPLQVEVRPTQVGAAQVEGAQVGGAQVQAAQVGGAQVGGAQVGAAQVQAAQVGGAQVGGAQVEAAQVQAAQVGWAQVGADQVGGAQMQAAQVRGAQVGAAQVGAAQVGGAQVGAAQVGGAQVEAAQVGGAQVSEAPSSHVLWLWVHPAIANDAHCALQTVTTTLSSVTVAVVKDDFAQFCLWGPRSLAVLASVLKPATLQSDEPSTSKGTELMQLLEKDRGNDKKGITTEIQWWKKLEPLQVERLESNHASFARLQELDSSAQVPAGLVLGAVVLDPRLDTPAKREHVAMSPTEAKGVSTEVVVGPDEQRQVGDTLVQEIGGEIGDDPKIEDVIPHAVLDGEKSLEEDTTDTNTKGLPDGQHESLASSSVVLAACPLSPSPQLAYSPLWNSQLRRNASESKVSNAILNKVRSSGLVRTAELHLGDLACRVPVLLVHQDYQTSTRTSHNHCDSGWNLICPKQWGMPFFLNLVYRCAHVCGLQELQQATFESGNLHFPTDYPDAPASQQEWEKEGCVLEEAYTRYPPAKRPNYGKLGVQSPFYINWGTLFKQNDEDFTEGFYVLRSQTALQALRAAASLSTRSEDGALEQNLKGDIQRGLVALDVTLLRKGCPQPRALICLPMTSDLHCYKTDPRYSGLEEKVKPSGMCVVENGSVRIGQSKLRKQELKLAKKQWKKDVKKSKKESASPNEARSAAQPLAETSLQLCETTPSRKIIGYITSGGFSHRLGCGRGVGFCPVPDLLQVLQQSRSSGLTPIVLVRNPSSRQYFVAQVAIH